MMKQYKYGAARSVGTLCQQPLTDKDVSLSPFILDTPFFARELGLKRWILSVPTTSLPVFFLPELLPDFIGVLSL